MPNPAAVPITANDRMKQSSSAWLPRSIVLAVIIHAAVLSLAPEMTVADMSTDRAQDVIVVPPLTDVPDPPEPIDRPATPIVSALDDIVMDDARLRTTFDAWLPEQLAPPRSTRSEERGTFEMYVPSMIAPSLMNAAEVERALVRNYPPVLRDAGIGGQVDVQLWLDEEGNVVQSAIARSSGYDALDAAALKVVDVMRLSPARNRNTAVRVIVTLPVVFNARD